MTKKKERGEKSCIFYDMAAVLSRKGNYANEFHCIVLLVNRHVLKRNDRNTRR